MDSSAAPMVDWAFRKGRRMDKECISRAGCNCAWMDKILLIKSFNTCNMFSGNQNRNQNVTTHHRAYYFFWHTSVAILSDIQASVTGEIGQSRLSTGIQSDLVCGAGFDYLWERRFRVCISMAATQMGSVRAFHFNVARHGFVSSG